MSHTLLEVCMDCERGLVKKSIQSPKQGPLGARAPQPVCKAPNNPTIDPPPPREWFPGSTGVGARMPTPHVFRAPLPRIEGACPGRPHPARLRHHCPPLYWHPHVPPLRWYSPACAVCQGPAAGERSGYAARSTPAPVGASPVGSPNGPRPSPAAAQPPAYAPLYDDRSGPVPRFSPASADFRRELADIFGP